MAYCVRLLDNWRIRQLVDCHLADWSTRGLDNSRTGQVADWTTCGCHRRLCVLSFRSFGGICETASCPVRDLTSPRVGNPRVGVPVRCPVTLRTMTPVPFRIHWYSIGLVVYHARHAFSARAYSTKHSIFFMFFL